MVKRLTAALLAPAIGVTALALGLAPQASAAPMSRPTVIGGTDASIVDSPWQVVFVIKEGTICSGSFISPTQILSAAHCFVNIPQSEVQGFAGVTKLSDRSAASRLSIASITNHPGFTFATFANDVALITLKRPAPFGADARTIALPVSQDRAAWPAAGTTALVSGWGETQQDSAVAANTFQAAQVQILAGPGDLTCGSYGGAFIPSDQICAGGGGGTIDACSGDSGGPMVVPVNGVPVLAGVVGTGQVCASAAFPGLYSRVTTFLPWLTSLGVDINAAGRDSMIAAPGTERDGKPAVFAIGSSYSSSAFARYTALKGKKTKVTVVSGKACRQAGIKVAFSAPGKCSIIISSPTKRIPAVVTLYSSSAS